MLLFRRIWRGLRENRARTHPASWDPRLRGRTYAIPFERVWSACETLARERYRRWTVTRADDEEGVLEAEARTLVFRFVDDVRIEVGLDPNAQTRVDLASSSRKGNADLGTNARRIGRFLRRLDAALEAGEGTVLDPRVQLIWNGPAPATPPGPEEGDGPPPGDSDPLPRSGPRPTQRSGRP